MCVSILQSHLLLHLHYLNKALSPLYYYLDFQKEIPSGLPLIKKFTNYLVFLISKMAALFNGNLFK